MLGSTFVYASASIVIPFRFSGCHIGTSFLLNDYAALSRSHTFRPLAMAFSETSINSTVSIQQKELLPYEDSSHNSATIKIPIEAKHDDKILYHEEFSTRFANTVNALKEHDKSSVWVEVPMSRASVIEDIDSLDLGFEFHHTEDKIVKLNAWLRDDIVSKVPEYATHHVGVGAVVINSKDEILCIRELRKNYHPWKIPTGLAELGESIHSAAEREVLEETGISATCQDILSFRHTHGMANGRSDLFFICRLIPEEDDDGNVKAPTPQACEIAEAQWLPLSEYRDMVDGKTEESKGHPVMTFVMNHIFDKGIRISSKKVNSVVPGRRPTPLYFPEIDDTDH